MATVEAWITGLLNAASFAVGAYLAVKYVLPVVNSMLGDVVNKYRRGVNAFVKLLEFSIYLAAARGIIGAVNGLGFPVDYIRHATPALDVISELFFPTLRLLVIGVGILLVVERIRLK